MADPRGYLDSSFRRIEVRVERAGWFLAFLSAIYAAWLLIAPFGFLRLQTVIIGILSAAISLLIAVVSALRRSTPAAR